MFNEYDQSTGTCDGTICRSYLGLAYLPAAHAEQEAHDIALLLLLKLLEVLVSAHLQNPLAAVQITEGFGGPNSMALSSASFTDDRLIYIIGLPGELTYLDVVWRGGSYLSLLRSIAYQFEQFPWAAKHLSKTA